MNLTINHMDPEQIKRYDILMGALTSKICEKIKNLNIPIFAFQKWDEEQIIRLITALKKSHTLHPKHADISENFSRVLTDITPFLDDEIAELVIPVFFFAAILKNEINHNTVIQRANRGNTNWGRTKKLLADLIPKRTSNQTQKNQFNQICSDFETAYEEYKKMHTVNPDWLPPLLEHAEDIELLKYCYHEIAEVQHNARIAFFVRNILDEEHDSENPMVTLIRMYIVEQLSGFMSLCEDLSNGFPLASYREGGLISRYYRNGGPMMDRSFSKWGFGYIRKRKDIQRIRASEDIAVLSDTSYHKLKEAPIRDLLSVLLYEIPISNEDIKEIKEYYLKSREIEWYTNFYANVIQYVSDVTAALNNKAHFEESQYKVCELTRKIVCRKLEELVNNYEPIN